MKNRYIVILLVCTSSLFPVNPKIQLKNSTGAPLAYGIYEKSRLGKEYVLVRDTNGILNPREIVDISRPAGRKTVAHKWLFRAGGARLPERIESGNLNAEGIYDYGLGISNKGYDRLFVIEKTSRTGFAEGLEFGTE